MLAPFRRNHLLPGFTLALGLTIAYLTAIVLVPLAGLFWKAAGLGWDDFARIVATPRVTAALTLSFATALVAATAALPLGSLVAWVLVRYDFAGKRIVDALVDLPFALPTAVAGIALTTLYTPSGWLGKLLIPWGIRVAYTPLGIIVALTFIGLPFVVRSVQPVLEDLSIETEEAAISLGANRWQTFLRVILPSLLPALLSGFTLAFARAIGEYGSVVFISGNMPMRTEILPLLIMTKLEQFDYAGASAIAIVMLATSFLLIQAANALQWAGKRYS